MCTEMKLVFAMVGFGVRAITLEGPETKAVDRECVVWCGVGERAREKGKSK
jgi:hypothetical protein